MKMSDFALSLIQRNPNIGNNPQAQGMIDIIRNNDSVQGAQVAQNLCNTYGVSKEDALRQAKAFFRIP